MNKHQQNASVLHTHSQSKANKQTRKRRTNEKESKAKETRKREIGSDDGNQPTVCWLLLVWLIPPRSLLFACLTAFSSSPFFNVKHVASWRVSNNQPTPACCCCCCACCCCERMVERPLRTPVYNVVALARTNEHKQRFVRSFVRSFVRWLVGDWLVHSFFHTQH